MINKFLNSVLDYNELTFNSKDKLYVMNKYRLNKEFYLVDEDIALCLIQSGILEMNSGNWETGERHYVLNCNYKNRISKINFMIKNIDNYLYKSEIIMEELLNMKIKEERLLKIKKVNKL